MIERLLRIELPVAREIIVVNDGSRDGTRAAGEEMPPDAAVQVVHSDRNRGKGHAMPSGRGSRELEGR